MLVDIHAHLDLGQFDNDLEEVLDRAKNNDVKIIINNGINPESNRKTLELSKKYGIVKAALGIYPDCVSKIDIDSELNFIKENKNKIIAIGEVGLDGNEENIDLQKEVFIKIINLAKEIDKPLIVHSRKAEKEVIDLLEKNNAKKAILHCFHGNFELIKKATKLGYHFSIAPNIMRSEHFQRMAKEVPLSHILTETDSPYLGADRNERNEPANVVIAIKKIAEIKNLDAIEVENNIFMNYQRIFL